MGNGLVFKICPAADWRRAVSEGCYRGSADDARDGFIHLSTAAQLAGTASRHFRGQSDLVLVAIEAARLGAALAWEPSRGGALFPHLYGPLDTAHAAWARPLTADADGVPQIPAEVVAC